MSTILAKLLALTLVQLCETPVAWVDLATPTPVAVCGNADGTPNHEIHLVSYRINRLSSENAWLIHAVD